MLIGEPSKVINMELADGDSITRAVHTGKTEMVIYNFRIYET